MAMHSGIPGSVEWGLCADVAAFVDYGCGYLASRNTEVSQAACPDSEKIFIPVELVNQTFLQRSVKMH